MYSDTLIDRAIAACGSGAELARRIGVSRVTVHQLKTRKLKISAELAVLLAAVVRDDVYFAVERVMLEMARPDMASRLAGAFHRPPVATGAEEMWLISDAQTGRPGIEHVKHDFTDYKLSTLGMLPQSACGLRSAHRAARAP
jgi:DNA-binding XRE family transcriptional regulator